MSITWLIVSITRLDQISSKIWHIVCQSLAILFCEYFLNTSWQLYAHAQTRKTDLNPGLDKPGQEKNYEMCESRAEIKQDDIEVFEKYMIYLWSVHLNGVRQTF
jgi:hypothetical protein